VQETAAEPHYRPLQVPGEPLSWRTLFPHLDVAGLDVGLPNNAKVEPSARSEHTDPRREIAVPRSCEGLVEREDSSSRDPQNGHDRSGVLCVRLEGNNSGMMMMKQQSRYYLSAGLMTMQVMDGHITNSQES